MVCDDNGTGVYRITNIVTGKIYIGSTAVGFRSRCSGHQRWLKSGKHPNPALQNSWNLHGETNFRFEVLEHCEPEDAVACEQKWIDTLQPFEDVGYNLCRKAGSVLGIKRRPETLAKMSVARTGKGHSEETKRRMSEISSNISDETRRKMSESAKRRRASAETREKMSKASKGRRHTEETRRRMSEKARNPSPELRRKRSVNASNKSEAWRKKISDSAISRREETSAIQRARFANPEERLRMSQSR
jgi:group I intron endonuclease